MPCDITAQYFYCFHCVLGVVEGSKPNRIKGESEYNNSGENFCSGNILHLGSSPSTGGSHVVALLGHE